MEHDDSNKIYSYLDSTLAYHVVSESAGRLDENVGCATGHFRRNDAIPATVELEIYQAGQLTVIGFGGREIIDHLNFADCYDDVMQLIRDHDCQTLAIDLTGIRLIPSGMLGVLMSVYRQNIDIHLFNASKDIREVLEITKLNRVLHLHEVDV